jgi:hypothetical protein
MNGLDVPCSVLKFAEVIVPNVILVRLWQLLKAPLAILVARGMLISVKLIQLLKANSPILITAGTLTLVKPVQL